jgi:hypothetical protein
VETSDDDRMMRGVQCSLAAARAQDAGLLSAVMVGERVMVNGLLGKPVLARSAVVSRINAWLEWFRSRTKIGSFMPASGDFG